MQYKEHQSHLKFKNINGNKFYITLRKRVDEYFTENNLHRFANRQMIIKSVILLFFYVAPFFALPLVSFPFSLLLWLLMGLAMAGVGMSVMHDANHGSYSHSQKVNAIMSFTLNMCGASIFNWRLQHNVLHHTFTNVTHADDDISDRGILKFSPHYKTGFIHRFQWLYAFMFYGLITLNWVFMKDFLQFFQYIKNGVNNRTTKENVLVFLKIVAVKLCYLFVVWGIPVWLWDMSFAQVLIGFIIMHFVAGNILTIVFQLAHTVEGTDFPLPNQEGFIENEWAIHQLCTTVNFSKKNKWLSWYLGGLNFQIEHHLFPKISHVHYPAISEIVKKTALEFNLPYHENATFFKALKSHMRMLKSIGQIHHAHI
ncbi:MAG: acyl-CoA desaturase [Bacteroidia bacterium]|nr:acyl-CoA desaturase [Bacteroidia bacterium]